MHRRFEFISCFPCGSDRLLFYGPSHGDITEELGPFIVDIFSSNIDKTCKSF